MKMKAVMCVEHGGPEKLVIQELPDLTPKKGEIRIAVQGCGVNFPDGLIIQDKYQFKPALPFVPGSEVGGVVDLVGDGVSSFQVGDKVMGLSMTGGFASQMVMHETAVIKAPPAMEGETAGAFMMTYGTSMHALKQRANLRSGETLLVFGAGGGVGLAAVEIGKAMGATVIAAASSDEKLSAAKNAGADHLINYSTEPLRDRIKEITKKRGVDVLYDSVGGDMFELGVRSMAWGGRALVIGFASGDIPKLPVNLTLLKSCSVVGVFWGAFRTQFLAEDNANFSQLLTWWEEGKLSPHISKRLPLENVAEALSALSERRVTGKVVLVP